MSSPSPPPPALPQELQDEILSLNAIYGSSTLALPTPTPAPSTSSSPVAGSTILLLSPPPPHPLAATPLLLSFPATYPIAPASVHGPHTVEAGAPKGAGAAAARRAQVALTAAQARGEGVFGMLAELEAGDDVDEADDGNEEEDGAEDESSETGASPTDAARFPPDAWTTAQPIESHKSVFVARAVAVRSAVDVEAATASLLGSDRHVARATHNIRAWRFRTVAEGRSTGWDRGEGREHQECDDDGEARAGAKVLGVMQAMGAWDVLVVVSRWYGGTKLGPERFRLIGQSARDVLIKAGWGRDVEGGASSKKGKKKG